MPLRPRILRGVVATLAALATTGCGASSKSPSGAAPTLPAPTGPATSASASSTTAGGGTGPFDSCSAVTQAQAAHAIGETVTAGVLGTATVEGGRACVFYGPSALNPRNPDVAQADSVRVVVVKGANAPTWYNDYQSKVKSQPVSGYGDRAYYDGYASLSVLKGASYLRIAVSPAGAPPSLTDEEQLATALLPGL